MVLVYQIVVYKIVMLKILLVLGRLQNFLPIFNYLLHALEIMYVMCI